MDNMVKIGSKVAVDGVIGLLSNIKLDGINVHSVTVEVEWDSNVDRAAKNLSYDNETNELTIIAALTEANKDQQVHSIHAEGIIATLQEQLDEKDKHIAKLILEVEELINNQTSS